ncbi:MAG: vitamin K epoxide reductase family protein, partial [Candidatus Wildermuthbacteria bacterium]|nr:vitamin K epoxide reductase family protein [Candidatus Wildermuthbacteria bacterium]
MTALALLFTLSAIGISETVYLIKKRKAGEKPVCIVGDDCRKVLESKYNKILGIHNDILGLVFYIAVSVVFAFLVIGFGPLMWLSLAAKSFISVGLIMSSIFTYLQWRVIKAWCFWCLMSAATIYLMAITILVS